MMNILERMWAVYTWFNPSMPTTNTWGNTMCFSTSFKRYTFCSFNYLWSFGKRMCLPSASITFYKHSRQTSWVTWSMLSFHCCKHENKNGNLAWYYFVKRFLVIFCDKGLFDLFILYCCCCCCHDYDDHFTFVWTCDHIISLKKREKEENIRKKCPFPLTVSCLFTAFHLHLEITIFSLLFLFHLLEYDVMLIIIFDFMCSIVDCWCLFCFWQEM